MAYEFSVDGPEIIQPADGKRYLVWTVTETDVTLAGVWEIPGAPEIATITLVEAEITAPGSGPIATIQPELSMEATVDADALGYVDQASEAAPSVRIAGDKRITNPGRGSLYGRSNPNIAGGATSVVTTRVTARIGHF